MAYHRSSSVLTSDMVQHEFKILKLNAKNAWLAVVGISQYMYHSNPLYTRNTGLSNCILGMSNLTADIHTIYGMIWKRISLKYSFLKFICWSEYFGNCAKRVKFAWFVENQVRILLVYMHR